MNIKKISIATLSTVMMLTPMASTILAEDPTPTPTTQTGTTTVTYTVNSSWEWNIPTIMSDIDLSGGSAITGTVGIKNASIEPGKELKITATGSGTNGAFTLSHKTQEETIPYTVKIVTGEGETATETAVNPGDQLFIYSADTPSVTLRYQVAPETGKTYTAGTYTGTVTYTATLVKKTNY